ncbi:uncharacterized protein CANTADRAFT_34775, partial [Suhomyces tanzawaensis NRRL Y-17324]
PENLDGLSPELIPIVTLLLSQSHRRYHEGIFMLYYDLNGDGKPGDREWHEVYGILTGNQLAYWDAANLAQYRHNPEALLETSSKPKYINFTDSVYNAMRSLPAAKQNLDNVVIVSTTLKNRYILQFKSYTDLTTWYSALRLANYEYSSLQEAYTGALLSARGSRLSDIRTILAEKRFDHEDWVSIRYGSGMAWKRCYAVVEPCTNKKKNFLPGRVLFYENEAKKKKQLMAVVANASSVSAIYPQSHSLIDHSTMLKLDAFINFKSPSLSTKVSKKSVDDFQNTSIFLMPEQHSSVPGFDTLIRFLVPLLDSFGLYGRPTRLKADRVDPDSLLFGLPTLPFVHYLEVSDITQITSSSPDYLSWDVKTWTTNIKRVMKSKLDRGYEGCGSQRGVVGAISSLSSPTTNSPNGLHSPRNNDMSTPRSASASQPQLHQRPPPPTASQYSGSHQKSSKNINDLSIQVPKEQTVPSINVSDNSNIPAAASGALSPLEIKNHHKSVQLADIYQKYSTIQTPSDQFHTDRNQLLNGSHEEFDENDMPMNIRQMSLDNVYPKNDDDLFSDPENDSDASEKVDARQIGLLKNGSSQSNVGSAVLKVPSYGDRSSSYSSVHSPMTQYHEFNEQFSKTVEKHEHPLSLSYHRPINPSSFSGFSDSEDDDAPAPPLHGYRSKENDAKFIDGPQGSTTPKKSTQSKHLSIHSESGNVISANSSPYSEEEPKNDSMISPYPQLPPMQTGHKPKYITSPNSSQNQLPRFGSPERKKLGQQGKPAQMPSLPPQSRSGAPQQPNFSGSQAKQGQFSGYQQQPQATPQQGYPHSGNYSQSQQQGGYPPQPKNQAGYSQSQTRQQQPQQYSRGPAPPQPQAQYQPQPQLQQQQYPPQQQYRSQQQPQAPLLKHQGSSQAPPSQQYRQQPNSVGVPPSVTGVPPTGYSNQRPAPQQHRSGGIPRSNGHYPHPNTQSAAALRGYDNSKQGQYQYQYN